MGDDEPKPLVFPKPKAGDEEPKALVFPPRREDVEPKPLLFPPGRVGVYVSGTTKSWPTTSSTERDMPEPKGLNFGSKPTPTQKPVEEPRGLKLPSPTAPTQTGAGGGGMTTLPRALNLPLPPAPGLIEQHQIPHGVVAHLDPRTGIITPTPEELLRRLRPQQAPAAPREAVIGSDPRAPALVEKAKSIDAALAAHRLFRNRLELFLDLRPAQWATWADKDLTVLTGAASKQSEFARQLSLANTVKWATDCEQAYKKPPTLFGRITAAAKPEFFRERLTQARDILIRVCDDVDHLVADLKPRLEMISLDALVLQVATADVTDPSDQITANRRLQTIVGGQQTALMIMQSLETLQTTIANQKATVGDLLAITIPNWIIAQSKA